jgi:hypothetical protein
MAGRGAEFYGQIKAIKKASPKTITADENDHKVEDE